jgi:glycosyltransferase involved in cell wall biosynthesis
MKESVLFSFVLPAYKAKYLKEAINSILAQTYAHFELIIVNDASPEDLESIIQPLNDPRIRYYRNEKNIGSENLVKNWNHCISYAQGAYLILASDDDVYEKEFLTEIRSLIVRYPNLDLYKARTKKIDENGTILEMDPQFVLYSSLIDFMYNRRKGMISCVSNYVFRTSALNERGGFVDFPAAWHSDAATVDWMARKGIAITEQVLFSFRSSGINISNQRKLSVAYDKLQATILYDRWFDLHIPLQAANENEAFLIRQIQMKRAADKAYMCYLIMRPYSLPDAIRIMRRIRIAGLLPGKQRIKLLLKYCLRL